MIKCTLFPTNINFNGKSEQNNCSKKQPKLTNQELKSALNSLASYMIGGLFAASTLTSCSNDEYLGSDPSIYTCHEHGKDWKPQKINIKPVICGENNKIGMNGYMNEPIEQGYEAKNCYFIASIIALANNEFGQQVLNHSMTINDDNSVELFDKRSNLYRKYSGQDILTADSLAESNGIYSRGDKDALPLQILEREIQGNHIGGSPAHALSMISGLDAKVERGDYYTILDESSHNPFKIMTCSVRSNFWFDIPCVNGGNFRGATGPKNGHSLAIVDIKNQENDKTVTIADPERCHRKYEITWEDFTTKLNPTDITSIDLSELL